MCIIAAKPAGIAMPTDDQMEVMWYNNPDGAGLMYAQNGRVYIDKGYMTLSSFMDRIRELRKTIDFKEIPAVLHFRIASAGGIKPSNCHPFPLTSSDRVIKQLQCTSSLGFCHNGTVHGYGNSQLSDTMQFMMHQIEPMSKAVPQFWHNRHCLEMIANATRGSWIALLGYDGALVTIGDFFLERNGIYYSNKTYENRPCLIDIYQNGTHKRGSELSTVVEEYVYQDRIPMNKLPDIIESVEDIDRQYLFDKNNRVYIWDDELDAAIECSSYKTMANSTFPEFNADTAVMTEYYSKQ